jgi:hypothetical protein
MNFKVLLFLFGLFMVRHLELIKFYNDSVDVAAAYVITFSYMYNHSFSKYS